MVLGFGMFMAIILFYYLLIPIFAAAGALLVIRYIKSWNSMKVRVLLTLYVLLMLAYTSNMHG